MTEQTQHVRRPVVAGRFYQHDARLCEDEAARMCLARPSRTPDLPARLVGAMVPHAGWVCSGRVCGMAIKALSRRTAARTFIMTGSIHTVHIDHPAVDTHDAWRTPLGTVEVDAGLRDAVADLDRFERMPEAHVREHCLEVVLPFMQVCFEEPIRIVPCLIPPVPQAAEWGEQIGRLAATWDEPVGMISSVDLTHYGPNYGFTQHGLGDSGRRWAHEINDRRLLDIIESMEAEQIVAEAVANHNTCGGGSVAATVAGCRELGAARAYLLEHTNSTRELASIGHGDPNNSVGYAAIVFG